MASFLAIIGALFQIILLTIQSHNAKDADAKQASANKSKEISDAVASGDVSRINSVVQRLRK